MDFQTFATLLILTVSVDVAWADCEGMTQCMDKFSSKIHNINFTLTNEQSIVHFLDAICKNSDALAKCYNPQNIGGCSSLSQIVSYNPSEEKMKDEFNKVCSKKQDLLSFMKCISKLQVAKGMSECAKKMMQNSQSENKDSSECSIQSELFTCMTNSMQGHCTGEAVDFFKTTQNEKYSMTCTATSTITNILLLCGIFLMKQLLL
ncbi:uncharacterized protein LOC127726399 [Mytilus californianus]|uniref:uncharacterized protein LOC127726399 n=1 Tax=Mytilus californianus TaxID=6549 RepID=UPI002247CE11|nr:uncharacterized protein LOC127726399 [Mytilus californianus]